MDHLLNEEQFPAGFLPAWFEARRRHALEQAEQLPEPSRHMESWRFGDRKSTRLNSSHRLESRMPSSA